MRFLLLAMLASCSNKTSEPRPAPTPVAVQSAAPGSASAAADAQPRSSEGIARASRPSLPKAQWPCAIRRTEYDTVFTIKLKNAPIDRCEIPINLLQQTYGGCPAGSTYDDRGRLTKLNYDYTWGPKGVIHESIAATVREYGERGKDIVMGDPADPNNVIIVDASGRPTRFEQYGAGGLVWSDTFEWDGDRIVRITDDSRSRPKPAVTEVLYDCAKLKYDD